MVKQVNHCYVSASRDAPDHALHAIYAAIGACMEYMYERADAAGEKAAQPAIPSPTPLDLSRLSSLKMSKCLEKPLKNLARLTAQLQEAFFKRVYKPLTQVRAAQDASALERLK